MRRREPAPWVIDLPGPVHDRFRPDLHRTSATRARRPPTVLDHHRRFSPSSNRWAVVPAFPRTPLLPPSRRIPPRRLFVVVHHQHVDGVVRHRPPLVPVVPRRPADSVVRRPCSPHKARSTPLGDAAAPDTVEPLPRGDDLAPQALRRPGDRAPGPRVDRRKSVLTGRSRTRMTSILPLLAHVFGRLRLSVPQHCLKEQRRRVITSPVRTSVPVPVPGRTYAASSSRMSSAPSSDPPSPSASKTEPKSSALRALSAMTFSSMVSLATSR